jgi:hypothetical protein
MIGYFLIDPKEGNRVGIAVFEKAMISVKKSKPNSVLCNYEYTTAEEYTARRSLQTGYLLKEEFIIRSLLDMVNLARENFEWEVGKVDILVRPPQSIFKKRSHPEFQYKKNIVFPIPLKIQVEITVNTDPLYELVVGTGQRQSAVSRSDPCL